METFEYIWSIFLNNLLIDAFIFTFIMVPLLGIWIYRKYYMEKK